MFVLLYQIVGYLLQIIRTQTRIEAVLKQILVGQASIQGELAVLKSSDSAIRGDLADQRSMLEQILAELQPPEGALQIAFNVTYKGQSFPGAEEMQIKDDEEFDVTLSFTNAKGHPATVDGVPEWTVDNANVAVLKVSDDGMSATVRAGDVGSAQVSVSADSDLGGGVTTITGVLSVEVLGGEATVIQLNPGEVRKQAP